MPLPWNFFLIAAAAAVALRTLAPLVNNNVGFSPVDKEVGRISIAHNSSELTGLKGVLVSIRTKAYWLIK
jgi:hypothetical protein